MPTGFVLANYPQTHVTDGCVRYVRSSLSLPRSRRRKKQCFADPQTRAIDDG
jgi:hypothetical protein